MVRPQKYQDFTISAPYAKEAKKRVGSEHEHRMYVNITCPHCNVAFKEILEAKIATGKAGECLEHLRTCLAAKDAGVVVPVQKKRAIQETPQDETVECVTLRAQNRDLNTRLKAMEVEMQTMRLQQEERDRESLRMRADIDELRRSLSACTRVLGMREPPPLPTTEALGSVLERKIEREVHEIRREHNALLLRAYGARGDTVLADVARAVRREMLLLVHPDKVDASARPWAEVVSKRLGELATTRPTP